MFRCQVCDRVVAPGTPMSRIVVATRPRTYPFRPHAFRVRVRKNRQYRWEHRDDPGGVGWEIAREASACPDCARDGIGPGAEARDPPCAGAA